MQIKNCVYFLSVEQAKAIAAKHEHDETWDIWKDVDAIRLGMSNDFKAIFAKHLNASECERRAS